MFVVSTGGRISISIRIRISISISISIGFAPDDLPPATADASRQTQVHDPPWTKRCHSHRMARSPYGEIY